MIPIIDFLNRIKWDPHCNKEDYSIGFLDMKKIKKVKFTDIKFQEGNQFSFFFEDSEIPFHRIKKLWKKNKLIWERKT
ncbi:DUF504 domain-containing protein [Nanoarchaeota archaeon]